MQLFPLIQLFYWLALATWFGGVAFVAMSVPVIFRTVGENDPTLPTVLSVNLEGEHSSLLAVSIITNLLSMLTRVELGCAVLLFLTLIGQWVLLRDLQLGLLILRSCLFVGAAGIALYDWRFVTPRIIKHRNEYIEHADEPEVAEAAKQQFNRYHRESITILL
ncbi:MAG TPA: hypothetical protein VFW23_15370, partial [Tepidisphaeraceae bacterium]|nr:hypothetical protein [Tepidisphaeraceae bacterium]